MHENAFDESPVARGIVISATKVIAGKLAPTLLRGLIHIFGPDYFEPLRIWRDESKRRYELPREIEKWGLGDQIDTIISLWKPRSSRVGGPGSGAGAPE